MKISQRLSLYLAPFNKLYYYCKYNNFYNKYYYYGLFFDKYYC